MVIALSLVGCRGCESRVDIDPDDPHQTIVGLGAFGAQRVLWESPPFYDEGFPERVVFDFGASAIRMPVYWDFEVDNDDEDPHHFEWSRFRFGPDSNNGRYFRYLRELRRVSPDLLLVFTTWTPPVWMKLEADDDLAPFCRGQCGGRLNPDLREEFAEYLAAFVQVVERETGFPVYALSLQNEPVFANPFESCVYDADAYAATLEVVGTRFRTAGLGTRLFGPEHMPSYDRNDAAGFFASILDTPEVAEHLHAYAVHGGGTPRDWQRLHARVSAQGKPLWMTETSNFELKGWELGLFKARELHRALVHGHVELWLYWAFPDQLLDDDGDPEPVYRALQPYFRAIRPGYRRVSAVASDPSLHVSAFVGREEVVALLLNPTRQPVSIRPPSVGGAPPGERRRSSETESYVALDPLDGGALVLPARSITALTWERPRR